MIPGEIEVGEGSISLNVDRETLMVEVVNEGDRPVQVGSHYHFFETNSALKFDRDKTRGYRLNIASGVVFPEQREQTLHTSPAFSAIPRPASLAGLFLPDRWQSRSR